MLIRSDTLQPWRGERLASGYHPLNVEQLWPDADLLAAGLERYAPFVLAAGQRIIGNRRWERSGGTIVELYDVEDIPPPTVEEIAARRDDEVEGIDGETVVRAAALVLLDESNRHAQALTAIQQAFAAASTLAALKTAIAAIALPAQRTPAQLRAAIRAKLDAMP